MEAGMWTTGQAAAVALSGGIGLSLGLVGGGGSIVTVPLLVYVAGLAPREAVAVSLPIVGGVAAVGAALQWRAGNTDARAAAIFAATGMVGALLGAPLTRFVPGPMLLLLFALLMIAVAARMLRTAGDEEPPEAPCRPDRCAAAGLGVGLLTGFLGVGGGFLIVPALLRFAGLPMRRAVGTSLLVIAANAAAGAAGHFGEIGRHAPLVLACLAAALVGLGGGLALGRRMAPRGLRAAFAGLALAVAAYLILANAGPLWDLAAGRG